MENNKLFESIEETDKDVEINKNSEIFEKLQEIEKRDEKISLEQDDYKEKLSAFAKELPEWSIEPLQIIVKRGK
ncbi:hypothetical protein [Leptotrichia wadei]|jgi:hypothetical protein|uniref:hypothetical protein n=1 Tax=Leptotrichia wadei TaxID=157687 RepID=UPI001CB18B6D|nr:hypothetical protein [Leptotrichia wadei]MBF1300387.1 hypothetical protein [Parvimonas sp.]